jgi:hypothetical protein
MPTRTNSGLVIDLLQRDYKSGGNLIRSIKAASIMTDNLVAKAAGINQIIADDTLLEIETWLAAHAYCLNDRTYSELQMGTGINQSRGVFAGQTGKGLDATFYGQMAKSLDPTGILANMDEKQINAGMTWLGLPPSQETPYWNRW